MRFTPTSCLPSIFWVACALAVAPPAEAWNSGPCNNIGSVSEYRSAAVRDLMDTDGSKPENFKPLQNVYRVCRAGQTPNDQAVFNRCLFNVRNYLSYLAAPGLGLVDNNNPPEDLSNDAYEKSYEQVLKIPECLENADVISALQSTNLSKLSSVYWTVQEIWSHCTPPGTIVLPYVSPATNAIDNAPDSDKRGRIVVWIGDSEKRPISHYVQFTVNANPASDMSKPKRVQASVVKVVKEEYIVGNQTFKKGAYIFDWARDPSTNKFVYDQQRNDNQQFGNNQHCYACHLNGVIAIHPFQSGMFVPDPGKAARTLGNNYLDWLKTLNSKYADAAQAMNQQINKDWGKTPIVVVNAPQPDDVPGPLQPTADKCGGNLKTLFTGALGKLPLTTQNARYEQCNACHQYRGKTLYNVNLTDSIMDEYVRGGFMPPDISAYIAVPSQVQRNGGTTQGNLNSASECFKSDIHERLVKWLEAPVCK
jgi:hypothetical protein